MGVLLQAECLGCGYGAELFAGFGFEGVDLEPRICHDCREVVSVPVKDRFGWLDPLCDLGHCPGCGGTNLQPFGYDARANDTASVPCPKCGGFANLYRVGVWD